ncbi:MAG: hypothetical protein MI920_00965 [Kiloniellales bacterium]|nr:hypothetical protein [Kiloniellales bacterium]
MLSNPEFGFGLLLGVLLTIGVNVALPIGPVRGRRGGRRQSADGAKTRRRQPQRRESRANGLGRMPATRPIDHRYKADDAAIEIDPQRAQLRLTGADVPGREALVPFDQLGRCEVLLNGQPIRPRCEGPEMPRELRRLLDTAGRKRLHRNQERRLDLVLDCAGPTPFVFRMNFYRREGRRRITPWSFSESAERILSVVQALQCNQLAFHHGADNENASPDRSSEM